MDYSISLLSDVPGKDDTGIGGFEGIPSFLAYLGDFFEFCIDLVSDIGAFILSNPLLLCALVLPLVGLGIGIFKRLLHS